MKPNLQQLTWESKQNVNETIFKIEIKQQLNANQTKSYKKFHRNRGI